MKGQKMMKGRIVEKKIDRISALPDSILTHILSFLDTKTVVKTSGLSKRWRLVWHSVPSLDFQYGPSPILDKCSGDEKYFTSFVNHVLSLHSSQLIRFRLSVHFKVDHILVEDCVKYAFSRGVQELKIRTFCPRRPVQWTSQLSCKSLRGLKLSNAASDSIAFPNALDLPGLKTLKLKGFTFSCQNYSNEGVFMGFPQLECLVLCKCGIMPHDMLDDVKVSGLPQLKNLEILHWRCPWEYVFRQSIIISSPALTCFKYKGQVSQVCFQETEFLCLDDVCIDLSCPTACASIDVNDRMLRTAETLIRMLIHLCNAKSLTLSLRTIEILSAIHNFQDYKLPSFGNMGADSAASKSAHFTVSFNSLTNFFKISDSGKTLVLDRSQEPIPYTYSVRGSYPDDLIRVPVNALAYLLGESSDGKF